MKSYIIKSINIKRTVLRKNKIIKDLKKSNKNDMIKKVDES